MRALFSRLIGLLRDESEEDAAAPAAAAPPPPVVQPREEGSDQAAVAVRRLDQSRNAVSERVKAVNEMTATEVTKAADSVVAIVQHANQHVKSVKILASRVGAEDPSIGIQGAIRSQSEAVEGYVTTLLQQASTHEKLATQGLAQVENILRAAQSIDRLARKARILAINARVAATHGHDGNRGFDVIAAEMQRLSDEVTHANTAISSLASNLKEVLPRMAAESVLLSSDARTFAEDAKTKTEMVNHGVEVMRSDFKDTLSLGDRAVEDILLASQTALSHLQFQDVVAQRLMNIDQWLREAQLDIAKESVDPLLSEEIAPPIHVELGGGHHDNSAGPDAGEIMLF